MRETGIKYKRSRPRSQRWLKRAGLIVLVVVLVLIVGGFIAHHVYNQDLEPADPSGQARSVTITQGSSVNSIAGELFSQHLIKSQWAFEFYVTRADARSELKAGIYNLSPSMNVGEIVSILTHGKVATSLVTILPGQRLDQVEAALIRAGFSKSDVEAAMQPSKYAGNPALVDKPAGASLEGFLYPDSFERDSTTQPEQIISESLQEMANHLTPSLRAAYAKEGLNVYQAITLASMVEQEAATPSDRAQVAQVFLSRLKAGSVLGSDVTAFYGARQAGDAGISPIDQLKLDTPYNTLINPGLPPGPISNVSASSLEAVAHPANTNWLYFVAGDNGKVYFSQTATEHDQQIQLYCHKLCAQ